MHIGPDTPLRWPPGVDRKANRLKSYGRGWGTVSARQEYLKALGDLGVAWAQLSMGGSDPGVVCYFDIYGNRCAIAVDEYDSSVNNFQIVIGILRGLANLLASNQDRLLRDHIRKLRLDAHLPEWCGFFGFKEIPERALLEKAHRKLVLESHPDRGGSTERMLDVNHQIAAARAYYDRAP